MLVILFLFDKEHNMVLLKELKDSYEYINSNSVRTETATEAVRRIAYDQVNLNIDDNGLKFVRRESYTVKMKGICYVNTVVTFSYDCGDADLSSSNYSRVNYDDAIRTLCSRGKYFQAAYLEEAYNAL